MVYGRKKMSQEQPVKPIMKQNSNMPEQLYDVEKIGDRSRNINKVGKVSGTRNAKTRGLYAIDSKAAADIFFSKPKKYTCECGNEVMSCFKTRTCEVCNKEMVLADDKKED